MEPTKPRSRVLKWTLIIGIVIVLNLFFNYAISLAYPSPDYVKFCPNTQVVSPPTNKTQCVATGGQWVENTYPADGGVSVSVKNPKTTVTGYCNPNFTCDKTFQDASQSYERNVFLTLAILGVISIVAGIFITVSDIVSVALSIGGVLSLVIASMRYWSEAGNLLKVLLLAAALAALIWLALKKFRE